MKAVRRMISVILIYMMIFPMIVLAANVNRDGEGWFWWTRLGGNPRNPDGLKNRADFEMWMLSAGGINDLRRCGAPPTVISLMLSLVQKKQYYPNYCQFKNGEVGTIEESTSITGSKYRIMTFGNGQTIEWVRLGFTGEVYKIQLKDKFGMIWVLEVFSGCANMAKPMILTVNFPVKPPTATIPPQVIPPPPEAPRYYIPETIYIPAYNRAEDKFYEVKGIWPGIADILARWLGATKVNFNPMLTNNSQSWGGNPTAFGGGGGQGGAVGSVTATGGHGGQGGPGGNNGPITVNGGSSTSWVTGSGNSSNTNIVQPPSIDIENNNANGNTNVLNGVQGQ